eukprot:6595335-Pyramimonas_sp.AAC.1
MSVEVLRGGGSVWGRAGAGGAGGGDGSRGARAQCGAHHARLHGQGRVRRGGQGAGGQAPGRRRHQAGRLHRGGGAGY